MLLDFLFPRHCVGCKKLGGYFCRNCLPLLKRVEETICPVCGKETIEGRTHLGCRKPVSLDGLISVFYYKHPIKEAIKTFKYSFVSDLSPTLAGFMEEQAGKFAGFALSPVPLFKNRENWRGFNQSKLLAEVLAEKLTFPLEESLERIVDTPSQSFLKGAERSKNVRNAFEVKGSVERRRFLLIDDVWTTGTTLKECAKVLKKADAKEVWALTLAR